MKLLLNRLATVTGTDCAALAAPAGDTPYAGLHTEIGEALGRAVYEAVAAEAAEGNAEEEKRDIAGSS